MNVTDIDCLEDIEFQVKILIDKVEIVKGNKKLEKDVKKTLNDIDAARKQKKWEAKAKQENENQEKRRNDANKKNFNETWIKAWYQMARSKKKEI